MVAYGTACLWWDDASRAAIDRTPNGDVLRCPYCGGKCETHPNRASFLRMALRFELTGFVGHHELMVWTQGRCFKTRHDAWLAYRSRPLVTMAS